MSYRQSQSFYLDNVERCISNYQYVVRVILYINNIVIPFASFSAIAWKEKPSYFHFTKSRQITFATECALYTRAFVHNSGKLAKLISRKHTTLIVIEIIQILVRIMEKKLCKPLAKFSFVANFFAHLIFDSNPFHRYELKLKFFASLVSIANYCTKIRFSIHFQMSADAIFLKHFLYIAILSC